MTIIAPVSYLLAALMFAALTIFVVARWRRSQQGVLMLLAVVISAAWAGLQIMDMARGGISSDILFAVEVLRNATWLLFLASVLRQTGDGLWARLLRTFAVLLPPAILVLALAGPATPPVWGHISLSLIGLVLIERLYRSAAPSFRRPIAHLTIAMVGTFGYDLVMYSSVLFVDQIATGVWAARGLANAGVVPFLFAAFSGNRDWSVETFVSRQAGFFGFALIGICIYLLLVAFVAVYAGKQGADLGAAAASILVFGATIFLLAAFLSDSLRRKAKVFVSKHFFRNRYDYREEWRALTQALYHADDSRSQGDRSIAAVAEIMHSRSAMMLMRRGDQDGPLQPFAVWQREKPPAISEEVSGSLVRFLESSQWVIDTFQYRNQPDMYEDLELPDWLGAGEHQQIVVPLLLEAKLIGLLVLEQETPVSLTYEDTDLLKMVGRQVAGLLAQEQSLEKLAEARQFRAYSRLTAFIMHDLKNLAAQQSLVVKNAAEHKSNPDFVDDAFTTIAYSVERMNRLIAQLAERDRKEKRQRVNIFEILNAAIKRTQDRQPHPVRDLGGGGTFVSADRDRMFSVFLHVLRNAQDACDPGDEIRVELVRENGTVKIRILDTGVGMDEAFVRERLFRPFESTKGVDGMGIGAYQVREYVNELGGYLDVNSAPGKGTTMTINLPVAADQ